MDEQLFKNMGNLPHQFWQKYSRRCVNFSDHSTVARMPQKNLEHTFDWVQGASRRIYSVNSQCSIVTAEEFYAAQFIGV
jgi:hypothetical protein